MPVRAPRLPGWSRRPARWPRCCSSRPPWARCPMPRCAAVVVAYSIGLIDPAEIAAIRRVRLPGVPLGDRGARRRGRCSARSRASWWPCVLSLLSLLYQVEQSAGLRRAPPSGFERLRARWRCAGERPGAAGAADRARRGPGVFRQRAEHRRQAARADRGVRARRCMILDCRAILDFEYTALKGLVRLGGVAARAGRRGVVRGTEPRGAGAGAPHRGWRKYSVSGACSRACMRRWRRTNRARASGAGRDGGGQRGPALMLKLFQSIFGRASKTGSA